jgi:hypothetical protein
VRIHGIISILSPQLPWIGITRAGFRPYDAQLRGGSPHALRKTLGTLRSFQDQDLRDVSGEILNSRVQTVLGATASSDSLTQKITSGDRSGFFSQVEGLLRETYPNKQLQYIELLEDLAGINGYRYIEMLNWLRYVPAPAKETEIISRVITGVLNKNLLGVRLLFALDHVNSVEIPSGIEDQAQLVTKFLADVHPLQCLRGTLDACVDRKMRFDDAAIKDLSVLSDLFTLASFPSSDKISVLNAMQATLKSESTNRVMHIKTSNRKFAEQMLKSAWLQVAGHKLDDVQIVQLLHGDPRYPPGASNRNRTPVRHPVSLLSQPADIRTGSGMLDSLAQSLRCEAANDIEDVKEPVKELNKYLDNLSNKSKVAALFMEKEFEEAIGLVTSTFPRLMVLVCDKEDSLGYSSIYSELSFIEGSLERLRKK